MKNMFSLVSNKLVLHEPARMRKTMGSFMVSAAHPLVKRGSYRLFRFSSFSYITEGVIYIGRPPLCGDWRWEMGSERRAFIPEVKFGVSSDKIAMFRNVATV